MLADTQVEQVLQAVMHVGWLGQRQFMQLLAVEQFELTVPQFYTLLHLTHCETICTMSDLARATHQSAASLTGVVDRLLDKALVERVRAEGDRRQVRVTVTERGRMMLHDIKMARHAEMHAALADLDPATIPELLQLLNTVLTGMQRRIDEPEL